MKVGRGKPSPYAPKDLPPTSPPDTSGGDIYVWGDGAKSVRRWRSSSERPRGLQAWQPPAGIFELARSATGSVTGGAFPR